MGERIGSGEKLKDILSSTPKVAEGVNTINAALKLSEKYGVSMPITEELLKVLEGVEPPGKFIENIFSRDLASELDWLPFVGAI